MRANLSAMDRIRRRDSDNALVAGGPRAVDDVIDGERWAWVTDGHILVAARHGDADIQNSFDLAGVDLWPRVRRVAAKEKRGAEMSFGKLRTFAGIVVWPATVEVPCDSCDGTGKLAGVREKEMCFDCGGDGKVWPDLTPIVVKAGEAYVDRRLLGRALACVVADDAEVVRVHAADPLAEVEMYGDGWRAFVMPLRWDGPVEATLEVQ